MSEIDLLVAMAKDLSNSGLSLERILNFLKKKKKKKCLAKFYLFLYQKTNLFI